MDASFVFADGIFLVDCIRSQYISLNSGQIHWWVDVILVPPPFVKTIAKPWSLSAQFVSSSFLTFQIHRILFLRILFSRDLSLPFGYENFFSPFPVFSKDFNSTTQIGKWQLSWEPTQFSLNLVPLFSHLLSTFYPLVLSPGSSRLNFSPTPTLNPLRPPTTCNNSNIAICFSWKCR